MAFSIFPLYVFIFPVDFWILISNNCLLKVEVDVYHVFLYFHLCFFIA